MSVLKSLIHLKRTRNCAMATVYASALWAALCLWRRSCMRRFCFFQTHLFFNGRDSTQVLASELPLSWKIHVVFRRSPNVSSHTSSLSNGPLQQVSPAFHLQFQQLVPSNGGKLFLDDHPLFCSSGDSAPLPLKLYGQIPLGVSLRNKLMSLC
jgi:hypothetical protein